MKKYMTILYILLGILIVWTIGSYFFVATIEKPKYVVVERKVGYEIRAYEPYIIAEVEVTGTLSEATNKGFRLIADYIFGNNTKSEKIAMTAPVTETEAKDDSEKIAMTAPVIDQEISSGVHKISFIMPSKYSLENIPKPNNSKVKLSIVPETKVAALRFTWYATDERAEKKKSNLLQKLKRDEVAILGLPQLAQYNPPLSMPLVRRNEILVEIE
jgi:hypothetical protein